VRLLRAIDRAPVPWKNGGGVTTEIAASPPGAGFDDFDWRVSMAQVATDGPFSIFPGIDRVLVVLEGGFRLQVEGQPIVELIPSSAPLAFPGDVPANAELLSGPALDLNAMARRGVVSCEVTTHSLGDGLDLAVPGGEAMLIVTAGAARLEHPDGALDLGRLDAVLLEGVACILRADHLAQAYLIRFHRAPGPPPGR
jgi:environmental stress-induced protein Ves